MPTENIPTWTNRQSRQSEILLAGAALLVVGFLVAAIVNDQARNNNREQSRRVDLFSIRLREAYGLLNDMQSSMRGYLLTNDQTFLETYNRRQAALGAPLADLQANAAVVGPDALRGAAALASAANAWQDAVAPQLAPRAARLDAVALAVAAQRDKRFFDDFQRRYDELAGYSRDRTADLDSAARRLALGGEALLALLSLTTLATLFYGLWLVRRIGIFANRLQVRQDRQQSYTRVISTLNGSTHLQPLVDQALPQIVDSVDAQAGVIYMLTDGELRAAAAAGLDPARLHPLKFGEGLPGAAIQQNRVLAVTGLPEDTPYRIQTGVGCGAPHSVANLPLRFGPDLLGVLTVASVHPLGESEIQQLTLTASQLATALSNVRAFEETQRQREELREGNAHLARLLERSDTLQEMGRELAAQRDLQTILQLVCRGARRLLRADFTAVATMVDAEGSTKWRAVDGATTDAFRDTIFPPHQGMAGRVIDRQAPVVIENFGENPDFPVEEFPVHAAEGMKSSLAVPLFRKERPAGALIVSFRRIHTISAEEIDLAAALAAYASVAIENARLLAELSRERDLVAQRAIELQEKNAEVERANRLKSEFVANMSHELRTPLNSILALSQILIDRLDGELNDEQDKQVHIIERNAQNLLGLINDILDLSKIEAGKLDVMASDFSVGELLDHVRSTVAPLASEKGLDFRIEAPAKVPRLHSDENKLKQILLNLLSNAVKFTERGSVRLRVLEGWQMDNQPAPAEVGPCITFAVSDTGIGIAPDDQAAIWQEFRQLDGSLARRYEGTGLGLAIVRRLVAMLGGAITLQSRPGAGSTFTFAIPMTLRSGAVGREDVGRAQVRLPFVAATLPVTPLRQAGQPIGAGDKPLALVVDDDPEVIYILEKYLRDEGYEIAVAQSGEAAIDMARLLHPFAMTLDVMLPGRDGWDVIQELKGDPQTANIPIIMLTILDNRERGYSLGAAEYLVKPVSRSALLERLADLREDHTLHRALIVEDDPLEQRVIALTLEDAGLETTAFASGPDALQWLEQHTPDIITLDLMMPGMDGFEALNEIKRRPQLRPVPVLIITAKDIMPEDRARLNSHIGAVVGKGPAQREELLREVSEQLQRRREQLSFAGKHNGPPH
jgi:signal transduction histidine kinase/DNA-binding response OmpR family regulator/CHASE3 domain sensor protein